MNIKFRTLIKKGTKFSENEFVRGRITAFADVICSPYNIKFGHAVTQTDEGIIINTICTPRKYDKFKRFTEARYPGLCEFNY